MALWALALVFALALIVSLPRISEGRKIAEYYQEAEIAAETNFICSKWGMPAGSDRYHECERDIQEIRAKAGQRFADGMNF
jgi:hypothetical protein